MRVLHAHTKYDLDRVWIYYQQVQPAVDNQRSNWTLSRHWSYHTCGWFISESRKCTKFVYFFDWITWINDCPWVGIHPEDREASSKRVRVWFTGSCILDPRNPRWRCILYWVAVQLAQERGTYRQKFKNIVELSVDISNQDNRRAHYFEVGLTHQNLLHFVADTPYQRLLDYFLLFYSLEDVLNVHAHLCNYNINSI